MWTTMHIVQKVDLMDYFGSFRCIYAWETGNYSNTKNITSVLEPLFGSIAIVDLIRMDKDIFGWLVRL